MGLHFHSHNQAQYVERGKAQGIAIGLQQARDAHAAKNPYDRLNTELELHILATNDYVTATPEKRAVSDAATKLREAVHELRHPSKKHVTITPPKITMK